MKKEIIPGSSAASGLSHEVWAETFIGAIAALEKSVEDSF